MLKDGWERRDRWHTEKLGGIIRIWADIEEEMDYDSDKMNGEKGEKALCPILAIGSSLAFHGVDWMVHVGFRP